MNGNTPLFRPEALDNNRTQWLGNIVLINPVSFTILTLFSVSMALLVTVFLILGSYTKRNTVSGQLIPASGQIKIFPSQSGRVLERFVQEGQYVTKGAQLMSISGERYGENSDPVQASISKSLLNRKMSLQEELDKQHSLQQDERNNIVSHLESLKKERMTLGQQIESQKRLISLASNAKQRYATLITNGYVSMDQFQQREAALLQQQQELQLLERELASIQHRISERRNDLSGLPARHENQLALIKRALSGLEQQVVESEAKRLVVITASQEGVVTAISAEPGQTIDQVRPLLSIVPANSLLQAELYAPSNTVGFIDIGDKVRIRYQAFPYQKFGQHNGTIRSISKASVSASDLTGTVGEIPRLLIGEQRFYRIRVELENQSVPAYGKQRALTTGMLLEADILQETRHLYEWVLEPLYSLTGKL
ncbi:HlyD family efflux transporter periplasmic adaptor subunit [Pseudomonas sp. Z5-35]|uniref:HlyD family secretion protein n=1 Tax=unclassified Pseudomonas TaxID=196821 RepID=UPI003DA9684C